MAEFMDMLCVLGVFLLGLWVGNADAIWTINVKTVMAAAEACNANGTLEEIRLMSNYTKVKCTNGATFELEGK